MSENNEPIKKNSESAETKPSKEIERQKELIADLEESREKNPSDELELKLKRERDTLRHLELVQKENPKDRGETKFKYAAKAALSRAIQPLEE